MALTEVYVDPSINADSGTGTIGDPYGDLQYAVNVQTPDSTNGDRFNIKAGTSEVLTGALSLAAYRTPTISAPVVFQGYTSAQGDGGIGDIDGNSGKVFDSTANDYVHWKDLKLHNGGTNDFLVQVDNYCVFENVEFSNITGSLVDCDIGNHFINCRFTDASVYGANIGSQSQFFHCVFENGTKEFTEAVRPVGTGIWVHHCVFILSGASDGIRTNSANDLFVGNSIWSDGGTDVGIQFNGSDRVGHVVLNNIVEGFSGTGGVGIEALSDDNLVLYGHNACYNNATNFSITSDTVFDLGNNETLLASPFTDAANGDLSVDTTVKATAYPSTFKDISTDQFLDKGAAQREEPAGGGDGGQANLIVQNIGTY